MRVMITGVDGYLGWSLAVHLVQRGHTVGGIDDYSRRAWVGEMGSQSAIPIAAMADRLAAFTSTFGSSLRFFRGDLTDHAFVVNSYRAFRPEAIVYLGEMPSAPYSMIDVQHAVFTQTNNVMGTLMTLYAMKECCPDAHLVKLGTMGEYGTPNLDIPEGFFEIDFRGRRDRLLFPRRAGSWYHQSKVHDTHNVEMACRIWGLRSTDIMQGVVYGTHIDGMAGHPHLATRFDFDQCFGTVINRFCAQSVIGLPLTPFGTGNQRRGFLALKDSMQCLTLALENPAESGEYRTFNQFEETYSVNELALKVQDAARRIGLDVTIRALENPRVEAENHYYNPDHQHLLDLGYQPTHDIDAEIEVMLRDLMPHSARILARRDANFPDITWAGERRPSAYLDET